MKGQIVYIEGHMESEEQAQQALTSFERWNWDVELHKGLTAETVQDTEEFKNLDIIEKSRLLDFKVEDYHKYLTKMACAINNIQFWKKVIEYNEPMAFIEHDAICITSWDKHEFSDYLILNCESVFQPPNKLGLLQFMEYNWKTFGLARWAEDYPLKYHKKNAWFNASMAPGTGAYAMSPQGAKKMIKAIETHGMDQSDFMINSKNVTMQTCIPSPVTFNTVNLSTSYGIQ